MVTAAPPRDAAFGGAGDVEDWCRKPADWKRGDEHERALRNQDVLRAHVYSCDIIRLTARTTPVPRR